MSTSDAGTTGLLVPASAQNIGDVPVTGDSVAAGTQLPGLAEIARLANDLFSASLVQAAPDPVLQPTPSAALIRPGMSVESQPRAPATPALTDAPVPPQEADFRAIPASLAGLLGRHWRIG
jgi:hypothetical protein